MSKWISRTGCCGRKSHHVRASLLPVIACQNQLRKEPAKSLGTTGRWQLRGTFRGRVCASFYVRTPNTAKKPYLS